MIVHRVGLVAGSDFDWLDTGLATHVDAFRAGNLFVALVAHLLLVFPEGVARCPTNAVATSQPPTCSRPSAISSLWPDEPANAVVDAARRSRSARHQSPMSSSDGVRRVLRQGGAWPDRMDDAQPCSR